MKIGGRGKSTFSFLPQLSPKRHRMRHCRLLHAVPQRTSKRESASRSQIILQPLPRTIRPTHANGPSSDPAWMEKRPFTCLLQPVPCQAKHTTGKGTALRTCTCANGSISHSARHNKSPEAGNSSARSRDPSGTLRSRAEQRNSPG